MIEDGSPLVSIVTPAYNAERFVGRAIKSALGQTYQNLEVLVVDDGSNDRTGDVVRSFQDRRVILLSQGNMGQGIARNRGIRASRGKYISFLDADDCYLPRKVEREVEYLETHPDLHIVFCDAVHFYSRRPRRLFGRRYLGVPADIFRELLRASFINPNTIMVHGDVLRGGILFREERYFPEEWDLYLRLSRAGFRFGHLEEALVVVEIRGASNTQIDIQWILKLHALEMFAALFSQMSESERRGFGAEAILRECKLKLAIAYLASPDPDRAEQIVAELFPPPTARIIWVILKAIPSRVLRALTGGMWGIRQRLRMPRWRDSAVESLWTRMQQGAKLEVDRDAGAK